MDVVKRESYMVHAETEKGVTTLTNSKTSDPVVVSAVVLAKRIVIRSVLSFPLLLPVGWRWWVTTNMLNKQLKRGHPPHWRLSQWSFWKLVNKFSAFYGTRMFTGMFKSACLHFMEPVCLLTCSKVPACILWNLYVYWHFRSACLNFMEPVCLLTCSKVPACILWNLYVYWHVQKCLPLVPILSQMKSICAIPSSPCYLTHAHCPLLSTQKLMPFAQSMIHALFEYVQYTDPLGSI
jgi:hypothetical protein